MFPVHDACSWAETGQPERDSGLARAVLVLEANPTEVHTHALLLMTVQSGTSGACVGRLPFMLHTVVLVAPGIHVKGEWACTVCTASGAWA